MVIQQWLKSKGSDGELISMFPELEPLNIFGD
jgi:hypothetical protein